ncbi:MAG: PAS domain S-box protein [Desulfobacterales bacterium]|jgi:PAS domain S-box-containing protein
MEPPYYSPQVLAAIGDKNPALTDEILLLRKEIQVARRAGELTADLVVKQFEETEKILHRFQVANAQRKAVLDSAAQISIIATNKEGIITVFNTGAENLLGYRAKELIAKNTPLIFHLKSELDLFGKKLSNKYGRRIEGLDVFFEFAAGDSSDQLEWTYTRKDGTQFPVRMTINALRDPDGDFSGLLFIAMDITEKKRSEKALMESERKYRLLVRNLPNVVYKGYIDGSIDFFDDKIEKITGYSKEEFLSREKNLLDLIYQEDRDDAKEKFIQALKTDNSYLREYRITSKSGEIKWVEEGGQIIYGENGEIEFITGAFLDITERKLAEQALHESEEKYRSLFDSGPNPIFVLDRDSLQILDANPMAEETYGYAKNDLIGRPFSDLGPVEDIYDGLSHFDRKRWPKACVVNSKVQHIKNGDEPFYVRVTACPIKYKNSQAIILATTDISEMVEKDAQLVQAGKMTMLGEMSAGIAHELNQPLNAIKMGNEYLKMMVEKGNRIPRKDLLNVASQVSEQVDRASEIINHLREFGRKTDFAKEKVDLNKTLRVAVGLLKQQLSLQNIIVDLYLEENLPPIWAHNNRIEQVIFNLVTNARDAIDQKKKTGRTEERDVVTIRSFTDDDRVVVAVSDTGIGISKDARQKIFEPFFTTKDVGKGLGLGLSITYGIVKDYGGEIEIQSSEGQRTTFKLHFPRA